MYFQLLYSNIEKHIQLNASEKVVLESLLIKRQIQKKEIILKQGGICKKLFFVETGSLRAFNLNKNGKYSTIMFAVKDWWITDMNGFVNQETAQLSIVALEDCNIIELGYSSMETLYQKLPKFERFFRILFQNAYIREQQRALQIISLTTEERYKLFIKKYPQIIEKVTQKQIASYLGVTPEFLSVIKKNKYS